jgi:phage protein D
MIDFKPVLSTANQVGSVTVHGWNRNTHKEISVKVTLDELTGPTNKDLFSLVKTTDREEVIVNEPVCTEQEARRRAIAVLSDRQKELVKVNVTTVGLPDLRAGRTVEILGVGSRLSGSYFITDTTHTIDSSGYHTSFNARRETALEGGAR